MKMLSLMGGLLHGMVTCAKCIDILNKFVMEKDRDKQVILIALKFTIMYVSKGKYKGYLFKPIS